MSKTKCIRDFECEVCHIKGMLQILTKTYARVRHYQCLKDGKPQFTYCRNSIGYIERILANIKPNPDQTIDQNQVNHDRKLSNSGLITENNSRNEFRQRVLAFKA